LHGDSSFILVGPGGAPAGPTASPSSSPRRSTVSVAAYVCTGRRKLGNRYPAASGGVGRAFAFAFAFALALALALLSVESATGAARYASGSALGRSGNVA
tara:strand:+ start:271 stop:570 length:300 start_codon:yes stop_codon:yes gene_type:complete